MIYARKSEVEQTLEEHIEECLKAFESLKNTKLRILFGNEMDARLSIVFHDSGKIFYQENFKNGKLSFPAHEIFSAFIFSKFAWEYEKVSRKINRLLCSAAILYHHHAMNVKRRIEMFSRSKRAVSKSIGEFEEILEEHAKILKKFLANSLEKDALEHSIQALNSTILSLAESSKDGVFLKYQKIFDEIEEENRTMWAEFQKSKEFRKRMIGLTSFLLVVDYLGVKGEPSTFGKVVREFAENFTNRNLYKCFS